MHLCSKCRSHSTDVFSRGLSARGIARCHTLNLVIAGRSKGRCLRAFHPGGDMAWRETRGEAVHLAFGAFFHCHVSTHCTWRLHRTNYITISAQKLRPASKKGAHSWLGQLPTEKRFSRRRTRDLSCRVRATCVASMNDCDRLSHARCAHPTPPRLLRPLHGSVTSPYHDGTGRSASATPWLSYTVQRAENAAWKQLFFFGNHIFLAKSLIFFVLVCAKVTFRHTITDFIMYQYADSWSYVSNIFYWKCWMKETFRSHFIFRRET